MSVGARPRRAHPWAEAVLAVAVAIAVVLVAVRGNLFGGGDAGPRPTVIVPLGQDTQAAEQPGDGPAWSDEFAGAAGSPASAANWRPTVGGTGFGNHELECNTDTRDTSALDGHGDLVITARHQPGYRCPDGSTNDYVSARLTTQGLQQHQYGHIRVRAQLPTGSGAWPAIWALGEDNSTAGFPASGEIDIAEVTGRSPTSVFQTLRGPTPTGSAYSIQNGTGLEQPASAAFHVYGIDWTPEHVTFSIDDHVTRSYTRAEVEQTGTWEFDKPFFLLLDLAVGGDLPGPPSSAAAYPQRMVVDYVRVYA